MLLKGDCRQQLATLPDNSVHAIITDPPYELGFMGKTWDSTGIAYNTEVWTQCLRVLKPGGHLLAFGGSRTYHRLACAIEDAGFEIRDQIMWVYGSGFPKSLNISKAIDKNGGNSLRWFVDYVESVCEQRGIPTKEITALFPSKNGNMTGWFWNKKSGTQDLTPQQFNAIRDFLSLPYGDISHAEREIVGYKESGLGSGSTYAFSDQNNEAKKNIAITAPATDAAKQWDGWGTALKPAHEPIVLARKPLDGTVANNVLTHGVGALNIDECRVGTSGGTSATGIDLTHRVRDAKQGFRRNTEITQLDAGRWPANFIHDGSDEVLELFPDTGKSQGGRIGKKSMGNITNVPAGQYEAGDPGYGDTGSAARFFYCAKASRTERNTGLDHLQPQRHSDRPSDDLPGGDNPRNRTNTPQTNFHPTVKPLALIHYLIKLVTPPGGTILDPFLGSGTTAVAAVQLGHSWIGCELTPDYWPIIEARVNHAQRLT